jgi:hypothetical protein
MFDDAIAWHAIGRDYTRSVHVNVRDHRRCARERRAR